MPVLSLLGVQNCDTVAFLPSINLPRGCTTAVAALCRTMPVALHRIHRCRLCCAASRRCLALSCRRPIFSRAARLWRAWRTACRLPVRTCRRRSSGTSPLDIPALTRLLPAAAATFCACRLPGTSGATLFYIRAIRIDAVLHLHRSHDACSAARKAASRVVATALDYICGHCYLILIILTPRQPR